MAFILHAVKGDIFSYLESRELEIIRILAVWQGYKQ